jgi:hypothetical protein
MASHAPAPAPAPAPADELRAAAFLLRNSVRGLTVLVDADLMDPLADWLDWAGQFASVHADLVLAQGLEPAEERLDSGTRHALTIARLINNSEQTR